MRESRHLPQAIVVEFLERLAYLGLGVQAAEEPVKERAQNQNRQEHDRLAREQTNLSVRNRVPYTTAS